MINDILAGKSNDELKSTIIAERILRDMKYYTSLSFGSDVDVLSHTKKITQKYGTYSWDSWRDYMDLTVKADWYDTVYLKGISAVTYNNKYTLVLDAVELTIENLKPEFQELGFRIFKAKVPVPTATMIPRTVQGWNGKPHTYQIRQEDWNVEERFMVATPLDGGSDSKCYAAKHPNAAAANLRKFLMAQMERAMKL